MKTFAIRVLVALTVFASLAGLTGCATPVGGRDYYADQVRTPGHIQEATVLRVRSVVIHNRNNGYVSQYSGSGIGAALGAAIGNQIGSGKGRAIATAVSGMLGGAMGTVAQNKLQQQRGLEIDLRLENGQRIFVTQAADSYFAAGQRVRVMESGGVYRVAH